MALVEPGVAPAPRGLGLTAAGTPHTTSPHVGVSDSHWCPRRCCLLRPRCSCPRRCCRRIPRGRRSSCPTTGPAVPAAAGGAPHDVVAVVRRTRCPRRCCRTPSPRRRRPHTALLAAPAAVGSRSTASHRQSRTRCPRRRSSPSGVVAAPQATSVRHALASGCSTPPPTRWLPQMMCWLHARRILRRRGRPIGRRRAALASCTAPRAFRKPAPCVSAS